MTESQPLATPDPHVRTPRRRQRLLDVLLIVSLSINVVGLAAVSYRTLRKGGVRYLLERLDLRDARPEVKPFQADWLAQMRKLPNTEGEIVFAGDSLVNGGPWAEFYSPIKNRGIGGETTAGLALRLDEVTESRPRKVFLLVGTNCLAADIPIGQIVRNYRKLLEQIQHDSPATRVYIIGVLPVNQGLPGGPVHDNASIRDLNGRLRQLATEFPRARFIDVSAVLADRDGNLRKELTPDGLHLNFDAYLLLGKALEPYVYEADQAQAATR
jgi:lysophospholipase L1-like esterase